MPDAHEVAPQISEVDQIALDFFNDVKSLTFIEGNICIAVKNDDTVLNGTYQQVKGGQLFLNFGQQYSADDKYIKMRITNLQPKSLQKVPIIGLIVMVMTLITAI